jgi:HSP20 family protein
MTDKIITSLPFVDDVWGVDRFFNDQLNLRQPVGPTAPKIKVNLVENDSNYVITADVPGVPKECVSARFDNVRDMVTITTTVNTERTREDENTGKVHMSERFFSSSSRTVPLRRGSVDYSTITATHEDGVLTIKVDKLSEEKRKENSGNIQIN